MSEHNRGAYAPPTADAPLSFDARQPVRGARPFPVTLIISGLVLIGLLVVIVLFYRSGMHEGGEAPRAVGSPVGALKSAAPADAQPQDPAAGLQIYQSEAGQPAPTQSGQPNFVPPPEQPSPRPAPGQSAQAAQAAQAVPPAAAAPVASAIRGPAPAPAPAPPAVADTAIETAPVDEPSPVKPVLKPAAAKSVVAKPAAKVPAEPAPRAAEKAKAKAEPVKPAAGAAAVQIGAVSSTALADKAWSEAVAAAPGLAAGRGKGVEKIDKDGHTLYRTAVTGFASRADAAAFCARLKAAGKACFVK